MHKKEKNGVEVELFTSPVTSMVGNHNEEGTEKEK